MSASERDPSLADPERWSDGACGGTSIEDVVGDAFGCVREMPPWSDSSSPARLALATRITGRRMPLWRLALATILVVIICSGAAIAGRRLFTPTRAEQVVLVPPAATVVVSGPRRRRLSVVGPARLEIEPASAPNDVLVAGGLLTAEAGDRPLTVRAAGVDVLLSGGAVGEIDGRRGAEAEVRALQGEVRISSGGRVRSIPPSLGAPPPPPAARAGSTVALVAPSPSSVDGPRRLPPRAAQSAHPAGAPAVAAASRPLSQPAPAPSLAPDEVTPPRFAAAGPTPGAAARGESDLLARAFQALRVDHNPQQALAALDEHQRRFPAGALRGEACLARLEALLAAGRKAEALALIARSEADGLAITRDMRLARAELLAGSDRCGEAMADFDELLSLVSPSRPNERALYGRAFCRLRAGDSDGARSDLQTYLAMLPSWSIPSRRRGGPGGAPRAVSPAMVRTRSCLLALALTTLGCEARTFVGYFTANDPNGGYGGARPLPEVPPDPAFSFPDGVAGIWTGYLEGYALQSGSDVITLTLDQSAGGNDRDPRRVRNRPTAATRHQCQPGVATRGLRASESSAGPQRTL